MNVATASSHVMAWMRFVSTRKVLSTVTVLKASYARTVFVWRNSCPVSVVWRGSRMAHMHAQTTKSGKTKHSKHKKLTCLFFYYPSSPFRSWGKGVVWGYPGWWNGGAAADVFWGGALCFGHTCSQGRFGLHICIHGSSGSHGGLLALWQRGPPDKQVPNGTLNLQTVW